ncbi:MAG: glycerate kinase [Verrucomicrobia bacterium]|nr:MAG: glycerate kinase [Verrucomicrobiota bacterium]PYJ44377.1 MAG: glycerate kinase [Verrucomicrobiota bacterium]PYL53505.1 MAG: glycerate kinase [Verrucomicrobiota bacterium]
MKILIAPDKFKGTLDAREVAQNIAKGLRDVLSDADIEIIPMADGGEGTAEAICDARGCSWVQCKAHDPLGREIYARYGWIDREKLAVTEMSEAAGMRRLSESERDPIRATTFGVGEMLLDATKRGANEIVIGLGGSATNDGGFGMARALGFRFLGAGDREIKRVVELALLERIQRPKGREELKRRRIVAAVDVKNPLLGENGATQVFGPQKGASKSDLDNLERALTRLAGVVATEFGFDYRDEAGAGAAGGLGFGLLSFCDATIRPGFQVVAEAVGLELKIKDVDVVITGEGSLDRQTLEGKTPVGVARLARKFGKPVFAFVGRATKDPEVLNIFEGIYENARPGMSEKENMKRAAELLRENARELAETFGVGL